jgi:hypothetical protein
VNSDYPNRNRRTREQIQKYPVWPKDCWRQEDFTSVEIHPSALEVWGKAKAHLDACRKHESRDVAISVQGGGRVFEEDALNAPDSEPEVVHSDSTTSSDDEGGRDRRREKSPPVTPAGTPAANEAEASAAEAEVPEDGTAAPESEGPPADAAAHAEPTPETTAPAGAELRAGTEIPPEAKVPEEVETRPGTPIPAAAEVEDEPPEAPAEVPDKPSEAAMDSTSSSTSSTSHVSTVVGEPPATTIGSVSEELNPGDPGRNSEVSNPGDPGSIQDGLL